MDQPNIGAHPVHWAFPIATLDRFLRSTVTVRDRPPAGGALTGVGLRSDGATRGDGPSRSGPCHRRTSSPQELIRMDVSIHNELGHHTGPGVLTPSCL